MSETFDPIAKADDLDAKGDRLEKMLGLIGPATDFAEQIYARAVASGEEIPAAYHEQMAILRQARALADPVAAKILNDGRTAANILRAGGRIPGVIDEGAN